MQELGILPTLARQVDRRHHPMEPTTKRCWTLYLEDTEKKLAVFSPLEARCRWSLRNTNRKLHPYKSISADLNRDRSSRSARRPNFHFRCFSSASNTSCAAVRPLVHVKEDGLVLIDEPELSVHVEWQKSFLPDLLAVIEAVHFDVILATHSPFIVGDRRISWKASHGNAASE